MAIPTVSIIGRPNVGKSSLLNALAGKMISIVEPTAGVTRDRVSAIVEHNDRFFELVDTGGYGIVDHDDLTEHVEFQIHQAIAKSDLVLFVVNIRDGIVPLDKTIAKLLRTQDLEVMLVANKADSPKQMGDAGEFLRLGFGEAFCVSATNFVNQRPLMEKLIEAIEHLPNEKPEEEVMKIALVGKRNAGKSTFVNSLAGENRVIVSEVPGTTRDAVDVRFEHNGQQFIAIDTAGVRKKRKMATDIEFYGFTRALRSIRRADVVLFLIDSTLKISQVDKKLAELINDEHTACIMVINKWDLAQDQAQAGDYEGYLNDMLPQLRHAPIAFTTATEGRNLDAVIDLAMEVYAQASSTISTSTLNKAIETLLDVRVGVAKKKRGRPRIYYGTQVAKLPVTLLLFVNRPELFDSNWQRFAVNKLRELLSLEEVPIRLLIRARR